MANATIMHPALRLAQNYRCFSLSFQIEDLDGGRGWMSDAWPNCGLQSTNRSDASRLQALLMEAAVDLPVSKYADVIFPGYRVVIANSDFVLLRAIAERAGVLRASSEHAGKRSSAGFAVEAVFNAAMEVHVSLQGKDIACTYLGS